MTKNTTGGSSHKKFARKNQGNRHQFTWDKNDASLIEVSVVKPLGDCRFHVQTRNRETLLCHVSSRFSGKYKHHNLVTANSVILTSLRTYETPPKHCDFIHKLSDTTPLDFFTTRVSKDNISEDDLDIIRHSSSHASSYCPENKQGMSVVPEEETSLEIDFDAI